MVFQSFEAWFMAVSGFILLGGILHTMFSGVAGLQRSNNTRSYTVSRW